MNSATLFAFADELQNISKQAALEDLWLKLATWAPTAPSVNAGFGRMVRQLEAVPSKAGLLEKGREAVQRGANATRQYMGQNVATAFAQLPDEVRTGIMTHPMVTQHGMHPHAAFQLMHMSNKGPATPQAYLDTAKNLGIMKTQVPQVAQDMRTVAPPRFQAAKPMMQPAAAP